MTVEQIDPLPSLRRFDDWCSVSQAAATLGVHQDTIRRMITRGEIVADRIGPRLIRVALSSIHTVPVGGDAG